MKKTVRMKHLAVLALLACLLGLSEQHGYLDWPPSRSTAWRYGFDTPPNYTDNELNCGGFSHQWNNNGGKCGECGDPYDQPIGERPNQAGGTYATGTIVDTYNESQVIDIKVKITAMHWGWWEFRICPVPNKETAITQECLDQYHLELMDGSTRFNIPSEWGPGDYTVQAYLPAGLACEQCVLQWKWHCGNSWGENPDGTGCVGCGPQEQFYGCADITIIGDGETAPPTTTTTPASTTSTESTTTTSGDASTTTTSTTTTTTTTTPAPPTPSPWPSQIPDIECEWIGDGESDPEMDAWCTVNCAHVPPYCPPEDCVCWQNPAQ